MTEALLMRAGPASSADLFHAIPLDILDPFLYLEAGDRKVAVIGVLERDRIEALELGIEVIDPFQLGLDSLLNEGVDFLSAEIETDLRACQEIGLEAALVPPDFPLAWADKLRDAGIDLTVDDQAFDLGGGTRPRRSSRASAARRRPPTPPWARPRSCCASCRTGSRASRCASACRRSARGGAPSSPTP